MGNGVCEYMQNVCTCSLMCVCSLSQSPDSCACRLRAQFGSEEMWGCVCTLYTTVGVHSVRHAVLMRCEC